MATQKKDVELGIGVNVKNAERVTALTKDIKALADSGEAATPAFERLGEELSQLGKQAAAADNLERVEVEIKQVGDAMTLAEQKAQQLSAALAEQQQKTQGFVNAQKTASDALTQTRLRLIDQQQQLDELKASTDRAGKSTDEYKAKQRQLATEIAQLEATASRQKIAVQEANAALRQSERDLSSAASASNRAQREVEKLNREFQAQKQAVAQAQQALADAGSAATNAEQAQKSLAQSLDEVALEAQQAKNAIDGYTMLVDEARRAEEAWAKEKAAAEKAAEYRRLQEATSYVRFWEQALDQAAAAEQRLAQQAEKTRRSQELLNDSFAKTGVRSAAAIRDEINEIGAALVRLANNAKVSGADFDRAFAGAQQRIQQLERELATIPGQIEKTGVVTGFLRNQFTQLAAAYGGIELGQKFLDANIKLETLRRTLTLITGSTEGAAAQIQFLQRSAEQSGLAVGAISDSFVRFAASAKATNIPLETMQGVFTAITNAAGVLGLSSDKVAQQLTALSQIANKGKLSLEELQGQLGESLPGALSIAAKGLGITEAQLVSLTESGKLLSEDFFPAFERGLKQTFGEGTKQVEGFAATWNRLKNLLTETSQVLGDSGVLQGLKGALIALSAVLAPVVIGISTLVDGFFSLVRAAAAVTAVLVNGGSFSQALSAAGDQLEDMVTRQNRLIGAFKGFLLPAEEAKTATAALGDATAKAGGDADAAASSWSQLQVEYVQLTKESEAATKAAEKLADAKRIEGDTTLRIVELTGNEADVLAASSQAADENAVAAGNVAKARENEVNVLIQQRAALEQYIASSGTASEAKKKELDDLNKAIVLKQAEAEKSLQQASAARQEAAERRLAAEAFRDNSARVQEYGEKVRVANEALARATILYNEGRMSIEKYRDIQTEAAVATGLLRDAIRDKTEAIDADNKAKQADLQLQLAGLEYSKQLAISDADKARRIGDEYRLRQALIKQKEIELEIDKLKLEAAKFEAEASIATAEAKRAELAASGQLTPAKSKEIDATIKLAEAKIKLVEASKVSVNTREEELQRIKTGIDTLREERGVRDDLAGGIGRETDARNRNIDAINSETSALQRRNSAAVSGINAGGTIGATDENGRTAYQRELMSKQGGPVDNSYIFSLRDRLNRGESFDANELPAIANALRVAKDNARLGSPGSVSLEGRRDNTMWVNVLQRIYDMASQAANADAALKPRGGLNQGGMPTGITAPTTSPSSAPTQPTAPAVYRVDLNFNGESLGSVNTASAADAQALVSALQQVQQRTTR